MEMRGRWDDRWGTIPDYTTGEVAITRKYQPLFLWSVLTFQLAFIHSLGRTSRHTSNCFAHHAPDIYNSPPLPYPSTTTPLYPTYFYTLSIEHTNTNHTKSSTRKHASIPPRRTFIFGQTFSSITPATTNPSAAGRREHGELRSSSNAKQRRRRRTPSTILPHRLTAPYQQRRRRRRGQRRSRAIRSPTPTHHSQWTSSPRHDRQLQHHGKSPLPTHSLPMHGNFPRIPEVLESSLVQSLSAETSPTGCARDFCVGDEDPLLRGGCGAEREKWFYYYDGVGRGYLADLSTVHGTGVRRWRGGYEASGGY